jgi:hypothetical protein
MAYPYFGFQQPNVGQQISQNPFFNQASQYQGVMPAALGGVGASPISNIQQGVAPNMSALMPLGMMGMNLMNQAHQQPGQPQQQSPGMSLMGLGSMMGAGLMGGGQQQTPSSPDGLSMMLARLKGQMLPSMGE